MKELTQIFDAIFPGISLYNALLFFMLILTRWLMMTITIPFFGSQLLPSPVRIGLASLLSALCFTLLIDNQVFGAINVTVIALLFLKEAFIGFVLGFFASLIFYVYEFIGELIDISRAASMSRLLVPELKHQSSPMGVLLFQLSLVVFIGLGFHRDIIKAAVESFFVFPVLDLETHFFERASMITEVTSILASLFTTAVQFALPVIVISFLIDLAFGLMNRVAPQINAYFLSLPAKMLGGLIIIFIALPFMLDEFAHQHQSLQRAFRIFLSGQ